ncbi:MAG: hypothetical protein IPJ08_14690 [Burkholderiales bacterium]|nr:hypothetical protein [Burkholderiales bacterium]
MSFLRNRIQHLVVLGYFAAAPAAWAGLSLQGEAELVAALQTNPPCCVIDARGEPQRQALPLADALRYKPGLRIVPTASVVVVADDDAKAKAVGATLARQHPGKAILAVRGGAPVWQAALKTLEAMPASSAAHGPKGALSFVIPHNTCETGKPLQVLTSKPKP